MNMEPVDYYLEKIDLYESIDNDIFEYELEHRLIDDPENVEDVETENIPF